MKRTIVILLLFFSFLAPAAHAADIEIGNAIGHSVLSSFTIRINNAPNAVSHLKFLVPLDCHICGNNGDPLVGLTRNNMESKYYGYQSGSHGCGIFMEFSFKEPLPKGSNGPLFNIPIYIDNMSPLTTLTLTNIEGDIAGWSIKEGQLAYSPDDNQNPVANAGDDKIVINSVTLDGSKCYDSDGMIASWDWSLSHRTNHRYDRTTTGRNVELKDLAPGVYDVQLSVTDNAGLTSNDFMVLVVSGNYSLNGDANSDGKLGLADIIMMLQVLSKVR